MSPPPFDIDFVWTYCSSKANRAQSKYKAPKSALVLKCPSVPDLKYSLRSACKNAGFFRRIYIVIGDDDGLPPYVDSGKVKVVRHSEIIPKEYLPTFNSNVIDSYLHKIPGLSERFLVFNDDTYICKKTSWTQFFSRGGKPINRHCEGPTRHIMGVKTGNMFVSMMQHAIAKYGMDNTRYQHQVQAFTKTLMGHYEERFKGELARASTHKYRMASDFNLLRFTTCFSSTEKRALVRYTGDDVDLFVESGDVDAIKSMSIKNAPRFLCINNTGPGQTHVVELLERLFPDAGKVEVR